MLPPDSYGNLPRKTKKEDDGTCSTWTAIRIDGTRFVNRADHWPQTTRATTSQALPRAKAGVPDGNWSYLEPGSCHPGFGSLVTNFQP